MCILKEKQFKKGSKVRLNDRYFDMFGHCQCCPKAVFVIIEVDYRDIATIRTKGSDDMHISIDWLKFK